MDTVIKAEFLKVRLHDRRICINLQIIHIDLKKQMHPYPIPFIRYICGCFFTKHFCMKSFSMKTEKM